MQEEKTTPMMIQWNACKKKAGSAIVLFRMGDFYECFYEDAKIAADVLELTLTKRQDVPMSGIPAHTIDAYLDKLVSKGYSAAIAEQLEDPKKTKGIVKRDLVRIVSPGTLISSNLLQENTNNYFVSIAIFGKSYGLAALDLSCHTFKTTELQSLDELMSELHRLRPKEVLMSDKTSKIITYKGCPITLDCEWHYELSFGNQFIKDHFKVTTLDGFGLTEKNAAICASGALLNHIKNKHLYNLDTLSNISVYYPQDALYIDQATEENLDLTGIKTSLLSVLDRTLTPMGARLLREWLLRPILDINEILTRQESIKAYHIHRNRIFEIESHLSNIKDIERLSAKLTLKLATPKDLLILASSLEACQRLKPLLTDLPPLKQAADAIIPCDDISRTIFSTLKQPPPLKVGDGDVIADGINPSLDEYRQIARNTKNFLIDYQNRIKEETGIKTLKIGYNRMFGYYIEISRGQAHLAPDSFERRQTLVNQERFVTPQLREFETKVLEAEDRISAIEKELYEQLIQKIIPYQNAILTMANGIARIDALLSLAKVAEVNNYAAPKIDQTNNLVIKDGRHPVIESLLPKGNFIPNDTTLNDQEQRLFVITGPNMAGKSTYIRQVALIVIMAQMGSFVPASYASIGLIDRIFTRIGASDDLGRGQSTFMKEMTETANILNNLTERSLIILDEIGRGTSTYDGISIAWSCAEYLLGPQSYGAKTLFATHYFELTKLETEVPGARNYHSAIKETDEGIYFLRKIIPGGTDRSYGIHVARLAGIPNQVISRAHEILKHLEETSNRKYLFQPPKKRRVVKSELDEQLLLF